MAYLVLKLIHIVSATILFGTGIGTAFYMFAANRRADVASIYQTARNVVIADWIFTTPAVFVQLATGLALVHVAGYRYTDFWVLSGLALYAFAGLCWLPVVWLQIRMRDMAWAAVEAGEPLPDRYWAIDRWWIILGSLAFPAVLTIFYLMVFKPGPI